MIIIRGLDTYYGRQITKMDSDSDGNWFIELEGDVRITNTDRNRKMPELPNGGNGLVFATLILDASYTQMVFFDRSSPPGEFRVSLSGLEYQIFDATQGTQPYNPQAGGYNVNIVDTLRARRERAMSGEIDEVPDDEELQD